MDRRVVLALAAAAVIIAAVWLARHKSEHYCCKPSNAPASAWGRRLCEGRCSPPDMAMYSYPPYSAYGELNEPPTYQASAAQGQAPPG